MALEGMAAVFQAPNQLCYFVCFFTLFVTHFVRNVVATVSYDQKIGSANQNSDYSLDKDFFFNESDLNWFVKIRP